MRILLVEDDQTIADNVRMLLSHDGYAVDCAENLAIAEEKCLDATYDLLIVDWMLPDGDGKTWCAKLRQEHIATPILMLTAKNQQSDIVEGLNAGADDYLSKPFLIEELKARIRALLRRAQTTPKEPILYVGDIVIDTNMHTVTRRNTPIPLAPREYALLYYLAINKDQVCDRMSIMSHAWNEDVDLFSNTVDVHIRYLRKKLDDPFPKKRIVTVKGAGYVLCSA